VRLYPIMVRFFKIGSSWTPASVKALPICGLSGAAALVPLLVGLAKPFGSSVVGERSGAGADESRPAKIASQSLSFTAGAAALLD